MVLWLRRRALLAAEDVAVKEFAWPRRTVLGCSGRLVPDVNDLQKGIFLPTGGPRGSLEALPNCDTRSGRCSMVWCKMERHISKSCSWGPGSSESPFVDGCRESRSLPVSDPNGDTFGLALIRFDAGDAPQAGGCTGGGTPPCRGTHQRPEKMAGYYPAHLAHSAFTVHPTLPRTSRAQRNVSLRQAQRVQ